MTRYVYDLETFRNFFTATFVNVEDESDQHVFCIGLGRNDREELAKFLHNRIVLIGYNNHSYDDPLLRFILSKRSESLNNDLYSMSIKLIDDYFKNTKEVMELRYPKKKEISSWSSIDLMRILAFDKLGISLKQTAINLKWHKIQDLPLLPDSRVHENEVGTILDYNLNDVLITKRLYEEITPLRNLREELSSFYGIDLNSASDSRMANLILEDIYSRELNMDIRYVRDLRTPRDKVVLGNCIAKFVEFRTLQLQDLYDRISSTIVYSYNGFRYSEKIHFANNTFALGIGGLHSEDAPAIFVTDEKYIIQDMDVASYYPNLIINNGFYPEHLGKSFIRVLKKITEERLAAKKSGDKVKADGLKITVNSIFGKLGSEYFWLLDPKQMLSTTVSGQMGLLMLIEELYLNKIDVISCNTDGIVCKIPRELESKYYEIAKEWERKTNLQLEFTLYKKYIRRDVNSYITEKEDGSTKEKGAFLKEVDLKKAYHMPIVAQALHNYFIKGIPVRETLESSRDIMDFCISQKSGANFTIELHSMNGIEKLQKTNRYYISKRGGSMMKREMLSGRLINLNVGRTVRVINNFDKDYPFEKYEVDYYFYEKEVMKIVDEIEPKQMTLFDVSSVRSESSSVQTSSASAIEEKEMTVSELNKLGKNQLSRKLETVVNNMEKIEGISPRYVYIAAFNPKEMQADAYCLNKGTRKLIYIDKGEYKKNRIEKGSLIYCTKFTQNSRGYTIAEYRMADKFKEYKEQLL